MTLDEQMLFYKDLVDKALDKYMDFPNLKQGRLFEAMRYSLKAGGKRIRPVLALEFAKICGGEQESALPAACAIEMMHTFSLIHDDLPCMDNDDMRRGRPSCHKAFDEATALLAGDALEMYPFEVLTYSVNCGVSAENALKMVKMLSWCAGVMGMIGGQQIDTEFEGQPFSEEELLQMYRLKTSRLLQGAVCMGCLSADADDDTVKNAFKYADRLGLAFQIIDDILDVCGDEKDLGKPIGSDKENNKTTYVTLVGLDRAKKKAELLTEEALSTLDKFENVQFLKQLTLKLLNRNK
ncbi:MAG: polyprenyl synthetase family protein [Ruminiclostridium sp.]|nr:polyprenyl synthetase family protein [Ruminiclostridium sp.]